MPKQWYNLRADMKETAGPDVEPGNLPTHQRCEELYPDILRRAGKAGNGQRNPVL